MEGRICRKCGEFKPFTEFYKLKNGKPVATCRTCCVIRAAAWKKDNPEKNAAFRRKDAPRMRERSRKHYLANRENDRYLARCRERTVEKYGLTEDRYQEMVSVQDGVCAICRRPNNHPKRRLYIDHNHETGVVRGLLCQKCNTGLGMFEDDPLKMRAAMAYIEQNGRI